MTKKIVSVAIVLLFTCLVVYAGAFANNQSDLENEQKVEEGTEDKASDVEEQPNLEAVLKEAKENGYTVRLGTKYDADGVEELIFVNVYSDEKEIKRAYFDVDGVPDGYTLVEYFNSGRKWKETIYDSTNQNSYGTKYEYDERNNMITQHDYLYYYYDDTRLQIHEIYHYEYDDQGRKILMWKEIGADTDADVDGYFGTTYYIYDEEGRLIREEVGDIDSELCAYTVYEYDGTLLVKEELYGVDGDYSFYSSGAEYEYDEAGRLIKSTCFEEDHECKSYVIYEYP